MFLKGSYAVLLASLAAVGAVKDDEYYRAGMGNPNTDLKMYWADAKNVLEDLDQFSSLYVQYHNCAWSQNTAIYEEQESGSADENDYWYMGATPNFAANVAYSLYGALEGESFAGCSADTFINSFTTNQGFETFASSIYYAGAVSTDYSQSYSSQCQGGSGIVCDYNYGFGYATFSTSTCDPSYATSVQDNLSYMNSAFESAQCVKIYDSSDYNNGNRKLKESKTEESEVEDTAKDRKLDQANYGGYGGEYGYNGYNNYYNYYGTALSLLYYSNACFIQNYWAIDSGCPDPYGVLEEYQTNFNKGVRKSMKIDLYATYRANMDVGKSYVTAGAGLFLCALIMFLVEQMMALKAKKRTRGVKTGSTTTTSKSVVELVSKTGGKIKKSASRGVKKAVAKVTKKSKASDKDGVMVATA
jgi:hypothetical protein